MNDNWLNLILNSDYDAIGSPENVVFLLMLAFVVGQIVGWTYMWTHRLLSYSQTFTASLVIMPVLVALMMMLMSQQKFHELQIFTNLSNFIINIAMSEATDKGRDEHSLLIFR